MKGVILVKRRNNHGWFWQLVHHIYCYRTWWLDCPSLALICLMHWEFYSLGAHPVLHEFSLFFRVELGVYWLIKEGVRWKTQTIQARRGAIFVAMWLATLIEFAVVMQTLPELYVKLPADLFFDVLYVLLGFLGLLKLKRHFARRHPRLLRVFQENCSAL